MKGKTAIIRTVILTFSIVIASCAKRSSPSGGPKDEKPPVVVASEPENGTINFKGDHFIITFDEYVVFDKLNEKFMVSPPMGIKPDIYLRGKSLHVDFNEELRDSTTYTFYFQDAIKDLNEGNPFPNLQFVFSTGNVLDSLSVAGTVLQASNLDAGKNVLVILHFNKADSAPKKLLPDYLSLADANGNFRINNIRNGNYNIFALIDNNNNKEYDLSDEAFAFADSVIYINPTDNYVSSVSVTADTSQSGTITVSDSIPSVTTEKMHNLYLFTAAPRAFYLKSSDRKNQYNLLYVLSLPPDTLEFEISIEGKGEDGYLIERNIAGDSINIWLRDTALISQQEINTIVRYPLTDSTGAVILATDTIPMRYIPPRAPRIISTQNPYRISSSIVGGSIKPGQDIRFTSPTPFIPPDTTKIRVYEAVEKSRISIPYSLRNDTVYTRYYYLKGSFKEGGKYQIVAEEGGFGSIYGESNDSTGFPFSVRAASSYGNLLLDLKGVSGDIIVQLLDDKENRVSEREISTDGKIEFRLLEKGRYRLRAVYDLNGDGKWTTGNYDIRLQPEPVTYFGELVEIMVNWDHPFTWDLSEKYIKSQSLKTVQK